MKMKKLLGSIKRPKQNDPPSRSNGIHFSNNVPTGDGPDAVIYREVGAFCESGAPGSLTSGDEYLHLPAIVDAAESSPVAANQAALRIRDYLGRDHYDRGFAQYNAIMLSRILTDNPGRIFTQNFDKEFIHTVKKLLRDGKDTSVQQILRETLDYFEIKSNENDSLAPLVGMWRKEKGSGARISNTRVGGGLYGPSYSQSGPQTQHRSRGLPPPDELAGRIEEARTTARLLVQTLQSTPVNELLRNDLVKEFADRARVAQKSMQGYMNAENPHPDDETMLTLIETSEQLNVAMSKHQRAILQARKATGATSSPQPQDPSTTDYMTVGEYVYGASQPPQQPSRPKQPQTHEQAIPEQQPLSPPAVDSRGRRSPRNENFAPPSGPPPGRPTNTVYSDQQIQPSVYNTGSVTLSHNPPPTKTSYEASVSAIDDAPDNPFTDAASYEPPRQSQNYSLFGRGSSPANRPAEQTNAYNRPPADPPHSEPKHIEPQHRSGAYDPGFTSTPSYIHRQDSAGEHVTMHGASPPVKPVGANRD